jgi:hypothetical protein
MPQILCEVKTVCEIGILFHAKKSIFLARNMVGKSGSAFLLKKYAENCGIFGVCEQSQLQNLGPTRGIEEQIT